MFMSNDGPTTIKSGAVRFMLELFGAITVICTALAAARDFLGGDTRGWHWFVVGIVAVVLSLAFYVLLSKTPAKSSIITSGTVTHIAKLPKFPPVERVIATGFIACAIALGAWVTVQALRNRDPVDRVVILITRFDGPDNDFGITAEIVDQLRGATRKYRDVRIVTSTNTITSLDGPRLARWMGEKLNASVVIWGWYRKPAETVKLVVKFEILRKPESLKLVHENVTYTVPVAQLNSFTLHTELAAEMTSFALFTAGLSRYEAENYRGAIACFTDAFRFRTNGTATIDPGDMYFFRGTSYGQIGEHGSAIADLILAAQLSTNSAQAYCNMGVSYVAKGDLTNALKSFDAALALENETLFHRNRGVVNQMLARADDALGDYSRAILVGTEDWSTFNNRGVLWAAEGAWGKAIQDYNRAIQLGRTNEAAWVNRAIAHFNLRQFQRSLADYNHALKLNPRLATSLIGRGSTRLELGDTNGALADFKAAVAIDTNQANAFAHIGDIHLHRTNLFDAITNFDKALTIRSNWNEVLSQRGTAYMLLGAPDLAIADLDSAIELSFTNASVYNARGLAYRDKGQWTNAIRDYGSAIQFAPDEFEAYVNRAAAFHQVGRYSDALADVNRALKMNNVPEFLLLRAEVQCSMTNYDAAIDDCRTVLARNERSDAAYLRVAEIYFKQGKFPKAIAAYDEAVRLNPNFAVAYLNRGNAYAMSGDNQNARRSYLKAIELTTNKVIRAAASNSLNNLR
jgi:tetratricopeptide (TPR) repeat protein